MEENLVAKNSTPCISKAACSCSEDEITNVRDIILDTFDITSEVCLSAESLRRSMPACEHGNSALNYIKNKLIILKQYKEAIVDLCHNKLDYCKSVEKLEVAWNCVAALISSTSPEATKNLLYWVLRQTLHLMLVGEWTTLPSEKRNNIRLTIEKSLPDIKCAPNSINRCEYILQYFDNPWSDKRLLAVLYGEARLLTQSDLDYLTTERGCMIVLRLQKLCETKCDEMAFTLSSKALLALRSVNTGHELRKSSSIGHIYFIFDIYLCLVHKFIGVNKFIEEVKRLGLYDALLLIRRNMNAETDCSRLIKFRAKVAKLSANITIATIMVDSLSDNNKQYYCAILKEWLKMHQKLPVRKFRDIARKLFSTACSSKHLHLACQIIKDMNIIEWSELLLELYVRVITADLNELELLKSEKTCSAEVIINSEVNLSYRYIQIADLLKEQHPDLTNECILTAFSLNPTPANYYLVKAAAHQKQLEIQSRLKSPTSKSVSYPAAQVQAESKPMEPLSLLNNDSLGLTKSKVASIVRVSPLAGRRPVDTVKLLESSNQDILAAPNLILDSIETIDLPSDIRIDLSVLLSSPRVKFLSWFQTWPDLHMNCQRLLKPGGKLEIVRQGLAVANDHLQFLNLDYDQFRDLPENDGPGIEKGYEIFVESDDENSKDDTDFVPSDEGPQRKKRAYKQRQPKHPATCFIKNQPSYEEINAQLLQLGEKKDPLSMRDPLDNSAIQNLLKQQSNLISPFNTFLLQYLSQTSDRTANSTAELDTLFRMFYIQQLQAQLQMSQSYTRALQQQVTPTKDPHYSRFATNKKKEPRKRPCKLETDQSNKDKLHSKHLNTTPKPVDLKFISGVRKNGIESSHATKGDKSHFVDKDSVAPPDILSKTDPLTVQDDINPINSNDMKSLIRPEIGMNTNNQSELVKMQIYPHQFSNTSSKINLVTLEDGMKPTTSSELKSLIQSNSGIKANNSSHSLLKNRVFPLPNSTISPNVDAVREKDGFNFLTASDLYKAREDKPSHSNINFDLLRCKQNVATLQVKDKTNVEISCPLNSSNLLKGVQSTDLLQTAEIESRSTVDNFDIMQSRQDKTIENFGKVTAHFQSKILNTDDSKPETSVSSAELVKPIYNSDAVDSTSFNLNTEKENSTAQQIDSTAESECSMRKGVLVLEAAKPEEASLSANVSNLETSSENKPIALLNSPKPRPETSKLSQIVSSVVPEKFCEYIETNPSCLESSLNNLSQVAVNAVGCISKDFQLQQVLKDSTKELKSSLHSNPLTTGSLNETLNPTGRVEQKSDTISLVEKESEQAGVCTEEGLEANTEKSIRTASSNDQIAENLPHTNKGMCANFLDLATDNNSNQPGDQSSDRQHRHMEHEKIEKSTDVIPCDTQKPLMESEKVPDSDTDTEVDDNEGEENPSNDNDLKKGNDTDSDTDSSGSQALVVQFPHRTYSRVSGSSDHSNPSYQQHYEQRSPPHKSHARQKRLLTDIVCRPKSIISRSNARRDESEVITNQMIELAPRVLELLNKQYLFGVDEHNSLGRNKISYYIENQTNGQCDKNSTNLFSTLRKEINLSKIKKSLSIHSRKQTFKMRESKIESRKQNKRAKKRKQRSFGTDAILLTSLRSLIKYQIKILSLSGKRTSFIGSSNLLECKQAITSSLKSAVNRRKTLQYFLKEPRYKRQKYLRHR